MTASYKVLVRRSAEKELRKIPKADLKRIITRIRGLAKNPRPTGYKKLHEESLFRLRQGAWRIVYEIQDAAMRVTVVKIGHRREVYRN